VRGSTFKSDVKLGERYRDTVSGYEGIATAVYFYLHGCERVTLESWREAAAEMKELTFDAPRLEHVETKKQLTTTRTGGFKADPPRRGAQ
jgi:hypothetical protein